MALAQNRLVAGVWRWLRGNAGVHFTRFGGVAAVALTTSLVTVAICDDVWHLTSGPTALISQVTGAIVSYVLSRWAWGRTGKPDLLRETIPFWIVFAVATLISWGFTKLGYGMAGWMHLHGFKSVLVVEVVYFIGNVITFLMRFVIFHYVLFTDRTKPNPAVAVDPAVAVGLGVPPGTAATEAPKSAEAARTTGPSIAIE